MFDGIQNVVLEVYAKQGFDVARACLEPVKTRGTA
jgi:hypothetical protein